jgi:hypothetical protein
MAKQWIVLFDTLGVDTLIPWDDLKSDDMIAVLSGKNPAKKGNKHVNMMILRAKANHQRFPEVWAYDTAEDYAYEEMKKLWEETPQAVADLVREKGTSLYKLKKEKSVIV